MMTLRQHDTPADCAAIQLLGRERYLRLRVVAEKIGRRPTRALVAQFAAIIAEMPADQRAAVRAAVELSLAMRNVRQPSETAYDQLGLGAPRANE